MNIFCSFTQGTKYEEKFKGDTPLTLLAPTNEAFEFVSADFLEKLKTNVELREQIIAKHVLTGNDNLF
jgi:uncharacterized surface protein with fasciclin (FAS1) repeats